ncbi:MAG: peptide-methionine (R)-S-oxide reductase MsrB [Jannaschia sp.]
MHRRKFLAVSTAMISMPWTARAQTFPVTRTEAEWRAVLSPDAFAILRENATEPAFSHPYHDETSTGTYHCVGCAAPVYASADKYASDTGWPAFDRAISGQVLEGPDRVYGALLIEVHCATCGGHLGHIFNDGPEETTGLRHCINGRALEFRAA